MTDLTLADIDYETGGRLGTYNIPCPLCGPSCRKAFNRRRPVMRVWRVDSGFATFNCCRCGKHGYARDGSVARRPADPEALAAAAEAAERARVKVARRAAQALEIWREAVPAAGTPVETYLRSRGITISPPPTLRFHHGLKHGPSGGIWPAMVAAVTRVPDHTPVAIHRTWLARDGTGKAPVEQEKMTLGPCAGGAVRLAPWPAGTLMVGEGVETCLSAVLATGTPAWAALGTSGLCNLDLPADARDVIILADNDENGAGEAAAKKAAARWQYEGRRVRIALPPRGDFNDLLAEAA